MSLSPAEAAGLPPAEREFLDLSQAQVLRRRISPADRAMTAAEAGAFQRGDVAGPAPAPDPASFAAPPAVPVAPAATPVVPVPVAGPAGGTAVTASAPTAEAPTSDAYPRRANDRINKLYGQKMAAEEYAAQLSSRLDETNRRLESLLTREATRPTIPYTNQYGSSQPNPGLGAPSDGPPPAGDFISRAEVQAMMREERMLAGQAVDLLRAHDASRAEALADFPDVFGDPGLRASADHILASDRFLRHDPQGPYKAAALARGLSVSESREAAAAAAAADVRKSALSGVGPSVAEGNGPPGDRESRYRAAMAYARQTQRMEDFQRARLIQLGQA